MKKSLLKTILSLFVIVLIFTLAGCVNVSIKTDIGGVYKSSDSGQNWVKKKPIANISETKEFLENVNVTVFAADPQDSKVLYVGTKSKGAYISIDEGNKWFEVERLPQGKIQAIEVDPTKSHVVYAAVNNTIYKTTDALRNWESVYVDDKGSEASISDIFVNSLYSNRVYVGFSDGRLIKSVNGGTSWSLWKKFDSGIVETYKSPKSNKVFAVTEYNGIFVAKDQSDEWSRLDSLEGVRRQKIQDTVFKDNNFFMVLTNDNIIRTRNGGKDWKKLELLLPSDYHDTKSRLRAVDFSKQNTDILYYLTDSTLYKSKNGGQDWITYDLGLQGMPMKLLIHPENSEVIYLAITKK